MILDNKIQIRINPRNIKHYEKLGYENLIMNNFIFVDPKDIPHTSHIEINCECDICHVKKIIRLSDYNKITKNQTEKYYCCDCKNIKIKETNIKKYGVDNVFKSDIIKEKIVKTNNLKYGVDYPQQNKEIFNKTKITNKIKYGAEYVQQNKKVREKTEQTSLQKYNNKTSLCNEVVKKKIKKKLIELYGVDNPLKNVDIKNKSINTRISNIKSKYKNLNITNINNDIYTVECDNGKEHTFDISSILLYHRHIRYKTISCTICNPINSKNISGLQNQLYGFIKDNYNGKIIINDRETIKPNEIDIYLPEKKLGFEFNGVYWHSELYRDKFYHYNKTEESVKKSINLFHIFEDDWVYNQDIIKSMILNKLNQSKKIYARNTKIVELTDNNIVKSFLETNHLQGNVNSKIKLGLLYNNELVSIMTFGKLRKPLGSVNKDNVYELLRFCNKLNFTVVGGASKLFSFFINKYSPNEIISYADRCHSNGNLYRQLNFDLDSITSPNYYYVIDGIKHHRFNYRKDILIKQGFDPNKSEHQIMMERGYYRIYDSGNFKFIYKIKKGD